MPGGQPVNYDRERKGRVVRSTGEKVKPQMGECSSKCRVQHEWDGRENHKGEEERLGFILPAKRMGDLNVVHSELSILSMKA